MLVIQEMKKSLSQNVTISLETKADLSKCLYNISLLTDVQPVASSIIFGGSSDAETRMELHDLDAA